MVVKSYRQCKSDLPTATRPPSSTQVYMALRHFPPGELFFSLFFFFFFFFSLCCFALINQVQEQQQYIVHRPSMSETDESNHPLHHPSDGFNVVRFSVRMFGLGSGDSDTDGCSDSNINPSRDGDSDGAGDFHGDFRSPSSCFHSDGSGNGNQPDHPLLQAIELYFRSDFPANPDKRLSLHLHAGGLA